MPRFADEVSDWDCSDGVCITGSSFVPFLFVSVLDSYAIAAEFIFARGEPFAPQALECFAL